MEERGVNLDPKGKPTPPVVMTREDRKLWDSLNDRQRNIFTTLIEAGVAVALIWGVIWVIKRRIRKHRADKEETKAFGDSKQATWAKQFIQAFDNDRPWGWGTDEELIRQTMRAIPSQEDFKEVADSYKLQTEGRNLIHDLSEELSSTEYEEMLAIKNAKPLKKKDAKPGAKIYDPEGWAKRLHAAVNYHYWGGLPGTDDAAIRAVFSEIPTQNAFYATATKYLKFYGTHLWDDLDGDLDWSMDWRAMLKKKPKK